MNDGQVCLAALVTAGARRVGKALALRLAASGYDIALHYNKSKADAENTAGDIEKLGRECHLFACDLRNAEERAQLISSVIDKFPRLSVLVNNASIWKPGKFLDSTLDDLHENMSIHLEAPYVLTRDFARQVKQGLVLNIIDSNVSRNESKHFAYLLSKKALYDFTLLAATELAPDIRVNAIAPGAVLVPEGIQKEEYEAKFKENPLQRAGSADDVADALEFFLKNQHTTGQCIFVSGGKHLL